MHIDTFEAPRLLTAVGEAFQKAPPNAGGTQRVVVLWGGMRINVHRYGWIGRERWVAEMPDGSVVNRFDAYSHASKIHFMKLGFTVKPVIPAKTELQYYNEINKKVTPCSQ